MFEVLKHIFPGMSMREPSKGRLLQYGLHIGAAAGEFEVLLLIQIPELWGGMLWFYRNYHLLMNLPLRNDISWNFDIKEELM